MEYALITGASKGIGKAIAYELAGRKTNVLLVARSEELLKELAQDIKTRFGVEADYFAIDLSAPDAARHVKQQCIDKNYSINILVNNAGYGLWGRFDTLTLEEQNNMLRLNMNTLVNLCYEILPLLKATKKAYILNVSSTAAYQAVPTLSLYAASKAFVLSFSRGLKIELKNTSVSVSCLSPGPTTSDFVNRARMGTAIQKKAEQFSMTAEKVAKIAVNAMFSGKAEIIPGISNILTAKITNFIPKWLPEKIAENLYKV
jgi:short-subunit dehydrogenase